LNISWGTVRDALGLVSRSAIRCAAQQIAKHFHPDKIILFGSYARGCARPDSDVDMLVVMKTRNEIDQSLSIEERLDPPFSLDVVVRTPRNLQWRLEEGDWFLQEAVGQGKIVYEKTDQAVGAQSRTRPGRRKKDSQRASASSR
jgi:predicted nucleotidyltransferase